MPPTIVIVKPIVHKQAFFALLDEYFESRPHLTGGGGSGGANVSAGGANIHIPPAAAKAAAASVASAAASQLSGGRGVPPPAPSRAGPPPVYAADRPGSSAPPARPGAPTPVESGGGMTGKISAFGGKSLNKFASNSHVSGAMGKVGAGNLADKWSRPAPSASSSSSGAASLPPPRNSAPPQPPPSRRTPGPAEGLQSQKSFGHVDTSSGMQAAKTMWRDPKSSAAQPPTANVQQAPALPRTTSDLPPPSRRDGAGARQEDQHALADAGQGPQAQALYDYEGGDDTDLPVSENQVVTIIAKTSDDWWTCEADGKQGLVPANYLKEL
ncbi:hypothetical protein Q8F55_004637 [Vanrija albida]|uniref:SH3 domain-containing protein n=1 Tax=Vanrija albida TaxID=181172 RepID=A0ABR3Q799_9TREE